MGYVIKQVVAASIVLISFFALMEHEWVNSWIFNGLGDWICIIAPIGVIIIASAHLMKDEPRKKASDAEWMKNFQQTDSFFSSAPHLVAQRVQRDKK